VVTAEVAEFLCNNLEKSCQTETSKVALEAKSDDAIEDGRNFFDR
jgi:hypothetical protein